MDSSQLIDYSDRDYVKDTLFDSANVITVKPGETESLSAPVSTFTLETSPDYVIDMQSFLFSAYLSIGKNGGTTKIGTKEEDPVTLCGLPLDSLFERVTVSLNNRVVSSTELHPFRYTSHHVNIKMRVQQVQSVFQELL